MVAFALNVENLVLAHGPHCPGEEFVILPTWHQRHGWDAERIQNDMQHGFRQATWFIATRAGVREWLVYGYFMSHYGPEKIGWHVRKWCNSRGLDYELSEMACRDNGYQAKIRLVPQSPPEESINATTNEV